MVNRLRQFATSNTLQILIIIIDAFRKNFTGTEEEQKSNVIHSAVKKRQEIGRGLRLPVDQNGLRVFDESVNKLYVMGTRATRTSPVPYRWNTRRTVA
ncbi:MAG: hypothetical protein ACREV4_12830 [Gammaproteobacteria bacterium]